MGQSPGHGRWRTHGRPTRRWQAGRPVNAIYKIAKVLTEIESIDKWMTYEKHPLFRNPLYGGKPVVEAGKIEGGYKVNQVPDWAEAQIDIRLLPGQSPEGCFRRCERSSRDSRKKIPSFT